MADLTGTVLALDLGGTRLKAGVVDGATGAVTGAVTAPTANLTGPQALDLLCRTSAALLTEHPVDRIGVCVPGVVDQGRIVALPGKFPGIEGRDIRSGIAQPNLPLTVVNDAIAYGAGEARYGAGAGHERVVVVTIGTGVGVCVLEHGRPLGRGPLGGGILGGQLPVGAPDGPADTNGRRGTIEARCRADALVAGAQSLGSTARDIPAIYAAVTRGEPKAVAAVDRYRWWLARGIAALCHAHTPSCVVLGGGPMTAGNPVVGGLQAMVAELLWPGYTVEVVVAGLGDGAAMVGLAHLAGGQP